MKNVSRSKQNLYLKGLELAKQDRYDEAVQALKASLNANFHDPEIHYGLGLVYLLNGDRYAAAREYEIIRSLDQGLGRSFEKFIASMDQASIGA